LPQGVVQYAKTSLRYLVGVDEDEAARGFDAA
jgi:hypothetical protein